MSIPGYARPELLASTEWLAESLGRPEVRLVDMRWRPDGTGRATYAAGHIPGATYLDWSADLVDREEGGALLLAGPEQVSRAFGGVGVGDGCSVVLYDDTASLYAARAWWTLRTYGFDSARILDGGVAAWLAEGRTLSGAVALEPVNGRFTPRHQLRSRLTTSDVRALLGSPQAQLLDARSPSEFRGFEGNTRRLGHIPGAFNVPVAAMTEPLSQRFRRAEELRSLLSRANVVRGRRMICYDGAGIGAAKLAYVLTLLGHDDVAVYDGGWAEWGDRLDLPVER